MHNFSFPATVTFRYNVVDWTTQKQDWMKIVPENKMSKFKFFKKVKVKQVSEN